MSAATVGRRPASLDPLPRISMRPLVSICVPTYQRPYLIREALASCWVQDYAPIEILVGDDSQDDATERAVAAAAEAERRPVHYWRNSPSLGQAENINRLLDRATGDRLIILHDDDRLLPGAVRALSGCWQVDPATVCAFGLQHVISAEGEVLARESATLNAAYFRTSDRAGPQHSALASALIGQMPNNGYLVLAEAARAIRFRDRDIVGDGCDYDFGIRLAQQYGGFFFLDRHTSELRRTPGSITSSGTVSPMYAVVKALALPPELESARRIALRRMAPGVVRDLALRGRRRDALQVYLSSTYPLRQRPRGAVHLLLGFWPRLARIRAFQRRS
jgi:glycosyltransferase involved in cell wall biosynthesis